MSSYEQRLAQLRYDMREISCEELLAAQATEQPPLLIDIREEDELNLGILPGALHVAKSHLEADIEQVAGDKQQDLVLYCARGHRSLFAAESLRLLGYHNPCSLAGGFNAWLQEGLPLAPSPQLAAGQRERYARHLSLPQIGLIGQQKLLQARVLVVGAGGLGCPSALYLAAAGVGSLGILDDDCVELSNLQRQILHRSDRIGQAKARSAAQSLTALNPDIRIRAHECRLSVDNVESIFADYDYVLDGTDNFATRYLINDACLHLGLVNVHAAIAEFSGQVALFAPQQGGGCYRCLFPEPPPRELAPSCAESGVIGALPGIIGCLQAMETIKHISGIGAGLLGKMLSYDSLEQRFSLHRLAQDPQCRYCASQTWPGYEDYASFTSGSSCSSRPSMT